MGTALRTVLKHTSLGVTVLRTVLKHTGLGVTGLFEFDKIYFNTTEVCVFLESRQIKPLVNKSQILKHRSHQCLTT